MNKQFDLSNNILGLGDNIELIKMIPDESIDMIYMDPPFNSNREYIVIDKPDVSYFKDKWRGGSDTYLDFLSDRIILMWYKMKNFSSICVHCDHSEGHYIKMLLDKVFGRNNFINEIVWHYRTGGVSKRWFARKHDTIFIYTKRNNKWIFNPVEVKEYYKDIYPDKHNFKPGMPDRKGGKDENGYYKYSYMDDVWNDISAVFNRSSEYIGFPTQKPLKLLERLISTLTNKNDIVLDPFMGSGTTMVAAARLDRKYIGFDQSSSSLMMTKGRLDEIIGTKFDPYEVYSNWYNYKELKKMPHFEFEEFIVKELGGIPNKKKVNDKGIDGRIINDDNTITAIQVKRSEGIDRNIVDNFKSAVDRENIKKGIIAAFSFTKGAEAEAARLRHESEYSIELKCISKIVKISMPPNLILKKDNEKIIAEADPGEKDNEIICYSWWLDNRKGLPYHKFDGRRRTIYNSKEFPLLGIKANKIICRVTDDKGCSTTKEILL